MKWRECVEWRDAEGEEKMFLKKKVEYEFGKQKNWDEKIFRISRDQNILEVKRISEKEPEKK